MKVLVVGVFEADDRMAESLDSIADTFAEVAEEELNGRNFSFHAVQYSPSEVRDALKEIGVEIED
jgi:hypothetical protein